MMTTADITIQLTLNTYGTDLFKLAACVHYFTSIITFLSSVWSETCILD